MSYTLPALPDVKTDDMAGPFPWCNWVLGRQVAVSTSPGLYACKSPSCDAVLNQCRFALKEIRFEMYQRIAGAGRSISGDTK